MSWKFSNAGGLPGNFGRGAFNIPPLIANFHPRIGYHPSIFGGGPIKWPSISSTNLGLVEFEGGGNETVLYIAPLSIYTLYRPTE